MDKGLLKEMEIVKRREFGRNLKEILVEKKIQQKDFAGELGVSPRTVTGYVQGDSFPTVFLLIRISQILDISVDYLLGIRIKNELKIDEEVKIIGRGMQKMDNKQKELISSLVLEITKK